MKMDLMIRHIVFFFLGVFSVFGFFFSNFPLQYSVLTSLTLENDKIVHRDERLRQFFTPSMHNAQTKKTLGNDKTLHSKRGHGRPFPLGFFVDLGWVRGGLVISLFFIIFPSEALARRQDATATLSANAPFRRRVRVHSAVKNWSPPVITVRLHVIFLTSRRVPIVDARGSGGDRFCGGCRFSLSCGPNVRSSPSCL